MAASFFIEGRAVGPGHPTYVVAELSANHGRSLQRAVELVKAARQAGADAVKVQTYTPDTMTIDCTNPDFAIRGTRWAGRFLYDLYAEASMPWEWQRELKKAADDLGLHFLSSPFDETAVDFLQSVGVAAYKVASFEMVDLPLLRRIARTGKPVLVSTGMATLGEIDEAVRTLRESGASQMALLKCTSAYPAPAEAMNLRTIPHLEAAFRLPVGLSDHTLGIAIPLAAVALGACIIEKHLTLSRSLSTPDSAFSLEPHEFKALVQAVREVEQALGSVHYGPTQPEMESRALRRSLYVVQDVRAGEPFSRENVRSVRPGFGLHPRHLDEVLGRVAARDIARGTPLTWALVGGRALLKAGSCAGTEGSCAGQEGGSERCGDPA